MSKNYTLAPNVDAELIVKGSKAVELEAKDELDLHDPTLDVAKAAIERNKRDNETPQ